MNLKSKTMLAAALAGALAIPALARAADPTGAAKDDGGKVPCWGINKCKGTGDCSADGCRAHGCHGTNACTGQGFIRQEKEICLRITNGRLEKAAEPATK